MSMSKSTILHIIMFSIVINLLMLTGPLFMLQVYDRVLTSGSVPTLTALFGLVTILYCMMAALDWIRAKVLTRSAHLWSESVAPSLFKTVIVDNKAHPLKSDIFPPLRDLDTVRNFLSGSGLIMLCDAPWVPIYVAILFLLHSYLGWFGVMAIITIVALIWIGQYISSDDLFKASEYREKSHALEEELRGHKELVRGLALDKGLSGIWSALNKQSSELHLKASDRGSFFTSITKSFRLFLQAGVLAIGAWLAIHQHISAGAIVAAAIILTRGLSPIEQLIMNWRNYSAAKDAWSRLKPYLDIKSETVDKISLPKPNGQLRVKNLNCFLPGKPEPLLTNVSFELRPGETLGILGPSGVGKTTLLKILLGVWPYYKGEVRLDGATLSQWDREELSPYLGFVPQDYPLFSGTIAENISRFSTEVDDEAIIRASKLAHIHEDILMLSDGYETRVSNRFAMLSAGQRQRVALACAFYNEPKLIILDEPNSNLDLDGNNALEKAIIAMSKAGSTIIVATHNHSLIKHFSKVLMLNKTGQWAFGSSKKISNISTSGSFTLTSSGKM